MSCNSLFGCNEAAWQSHILQRGRTRGEESGGAEKGRDLGGEQHPPGTFPPPQNKGWDSPSPCLSFPSPDHPRAEAPHLCEGGGGGCGEGFGCLLPPPCRRTPAPGGYRGRWEVLCLPPQWWWQRGPGSCESPVSPHLQQPGAAIGMLTPAAFAPPQPHPPPPSAGEMMDAMGGGDQGGGGRRGAEQGGVVSTKLRVHPQRWHGTSAPALPGAPTCGHGSPLRLGRWGGLTWHKLALPQG